MCLVLFFFGPYRHLLRELSVRTEHYEYYCIVYTKPKFRKRGYTYVTNNVCVVVVRVMSKQHRSCARFWLLMTTDGQNKSHLIWLRAYMRLV